MPNDVSSPKRFRLRFAVLLLVFVCLLAFGLRAFQLQLAASQQAAASVATFDARLQNLEEGTVSQEKRLRALEAAGTAPKTAAEPEQAAPQNGIDGTRIATLEKDVAALKAAPAVAAEASAQAGQSIRMLSAFHRLSQKIIAGKPFGQELSEFESAASPDESSGSPLATFAPYADSGIPTYTTLLASFDESVETLQQSDTPPPSRAGLWEHLKYNLSHLVTVRHINSEQTGASQNAILGRAEAHLERAEIEAAMAEVKSLPDATRGSFAAWLDDAQTVTEAPSLLDALEEQVMQKAFHTRAEAPSTPPAQPAVPDAPPSPADTLTPRT